VIVKRERLSTQEIDDSGEVPVGQAVSDTWYHFKVRWKLNSPKLIVSVVYDSEAQYRNKQAMKLMLSDLVHIAAKEGLLSILHVLSLRMYMYLL